MDNIDTISNQTILNEESINSIKEHALLYDTAYDKKDFLKNVSPYEQKIILMNSSRPYEVLNYLDELDLKGTRVLLEQLNYDEIKHIISLFTGEDKKKFYANFSDLSLVNQFIVQDRNASDHVEDLSFERKVEILDSSDKETEVATSAIYESMSAEERVSAAEKVTDVDASYTLEGTNIYSDTQDRIEDSEIAEQEGQLEGTQEEPQIEQVQEVQTQQDNENEQIEEETNEQEPVSEKLETPEPEEIIDTANGLSYDYKEVSESRDSTALDQFQAEKAKCEQIEILNLMNQEPQLNSGVSTKTY